ncbi:MAG: RloB family protein [Succinivibrio sp.]
MRKAGYTKKERDSKSRKRTPIIFINAEGKNKTETLYLKGFENRNFRFQFSSDIRTDPINMVKDLKKFMGLNGFNEEFGDKAFCLIDADFIPTKNSKIAEADETAKNNKIELIVSAPCFEIWFLFHYCNTSRSFSSYAQLEKLLLGYIDNYKKNTPGLYRQLESKLDTAMINAEMQENQLLQQNLKLHTVEFTPSTEVYKIIKVIKQITNR